MAHPEPSSPRRWAVVLGTAVLTALTAGWFLLSWAVMHNTFADAGAEAFGVAFALLIVVSVVGAFRRRP